MYTGTLINDLIATAERVEGMLKEESLANELHEIFTMQIQVAEGDRTFMGAA